MNYFFLKLIPPRPTFPMDMTEGEQAIMQEHFGYWSTLLSDHKVVAYGPVMDPKGAFGVAIVEVENMDIAKDIATKDPAIKSSAGFDFEVHQMPNAIARQ